MNILPLSQDTGCTAKDTDGLVVVINTIESLLFLRGVGHIRIAGLPPSVEWARTAVPSPEVDAAEDVAALMAAEHMVEDKTVVGIPGNSAGARKELSTIARITEFLNDQWLV